jgi:Family of unknown function (DUF6445)
MLFVVDGIYHDPDSIRELALSLEFTSRARNFPGLRSTRTLIPEEISETVKRLIQIDPASPDHHIPYHGCFQVMRKDDGKRAYVHADHAALFAGLVYLSPSVNPKGGTEFFRHRLTGLTRFPLKSEIQTTAENLDLSSEELLALLKADRVDAKKWEKLDSISFQYNRFVFYDAHLFHKNGETWGSELSDARLTHNFFI